MTTLSVAVGASAPTTTVRTDVVPVSLHPDFEEKEAYDYAIACLICLGTNFLINAEPLHFTIAGLVVQTVLFVETMSRWAEHHSDINSKMRESPGDNEVAETAPFV
jgi:hypothetical protein